MYFTPVNYQSHAAVNNRANNISMKGKNIPYCLDTQIFDTFLKRLENLRSSSLANITKALKDNVERNRTIILNGEKANVANAEALAAEMGLPLYKITPQDFVNKEMKKELVGDASYYIRQTVQQLRYKYMTTGERSILLLEDVDKMLENDFRSDKKAQINLLLYEAKANGIIPVFTNCNSATAINSSLVKNVSVI